MEFAYTGHSCILLFDVRGFTHYPSIFVQVDNGPISKTTLSSTVTTIAVTPLYNAQPNGPPPFQQVSSACHLVRWWVASHSLYQTSATGKQWTTLVGGCKFNGVMLQDGELVPLPYSSNQIEFLGDSITQGLRLLYVGSEDDTGQQLPCANWPQYVADLLGMKPVVTGFGGQGLTASGTCGVPPANAAFPFIYQGVRWDPPVEPKVVVIYQGTNDGVAAAAFQNSYRTLLETVRRRYSSAGIFAVCPHNKGNYAVAIKNAVNKLADPRIVFLDYSTGVISPKDTSDGCHLNPGGAVRLAARLAKDIQTRWKR